MTTSSKRQALKDRFDALDTKKWEKPRRRAQQRGLLFEALVQDLFEECGLLLRRSYHTQDNRAEQVDGAIKAGASIALVETKWVKPQLAASDLFAFLGKVESKFVGTIGLFVSRNPLSENFLSALRSGRRQSIVVVHGEDADRLFDPSFPVEEYLDAHIQHFGLDNASHLSANRFLTGREIDASTKKATPKGSQATQFLRKCVSDQSAGNLVDEFAASLSVSDRVDATLQLLKKYKAIATSKNNPHEAWRGQNLDAFLSELLKLLPQNCTQADQEFFIELLSPDFQSAEYGPLAERFASRFPLLANEEREMVEKRLRKQWEKVLGDYDAENRLAIPTGHMWKELSAGSHAALIPLLVEIVLSQRLTRYPQYQLAVRIFRETPEGSADAGAIEKAFKTTIRESVRNWLDAGWTDVKGRERVERFLKEANAAIRPYVRHYEQQIGQIVREESTVQKIPS